nr:DUF4007 family protein [uncultured Marinifilum sp.]
MAKYTFSGHETFYCRHYWLKKGYDFLQEGNKFSDDNAVTKLGVGKNMVTSIRFWIRAFGILNENKDGENNQLTSKFGDCIFSDNGFDPFLEDTNSLWLLHYHLVKKGYASIYNLFFNKLKNGSREFTDERIKKGLIYLTEEHNQERPSDKTLDSDIKVFKANYMQPKNPKNIEDEFIGLLQELRLFESNKNIAVDNTDRDEISDELFLYCLLDRFQGENSISVENILKTNNSPALIFCITEHGVIKKLKRLEERYDSIVFSENSGVRELQFQQPLNKWEILGEYYG